MASIFLAVFRSVPEGGKDVILRKMQEISAFMKPTFPENIDCEYSCSDLAGLVINSVHSGILHHEMNVCCGINEKPPAEWWKSTTIPSSASLLITTNYEQCRVLSNLVAGRSIWYFFNKDLFLISSSQRAMIAWMGSFESNPQAISWMLATGNLGPGNSWDRRIKHLGAGEVLALQRNSWKLEAYTGTETIVKPSQLSNAELTGKLEEILDHNFSNSNLSIPVPSSVLTLSGGYDSRFVLYNLVKNGIKITTATWGLSASQSVEYSDAHVASLLAKRLGVEHRYFKTDFKEKSFEPLLEQFLKFGEGRLDHINSFMDGFKMWQQLYSEGYRNVIRADEVFGWLPSKTAQDVRISLDFHAMEDNANMCPFREFGLEPQLYPQQMLHQPEESLEAWRDRIYREFRMPYVLTALHDLVQPYMEVINPLLNENIVNFCKQLPDNFRTGKSLYAKYVTELIPDIPIARKASIPEPAAILKYSRIVSLMLDELASTESRNILGGKFIRWNQENLKVDDNLINTTNDNWTLWIKSHIPWRIKKLLRKDLIKYSGDFNQLAFRAVIIIRMHRMLSEDAVILKTMEEKVGYG